jgi:hypothetical protein
VLETTGEGDLSQGWAELAFNPQTGIVGGSAIFRQTVAGRPPFEAVAPLSNLFDRSVTIPFDNSEGFSTGLAIVNGSFRSPSRVSAEFRNETGTVVLIESFDIPASGQVVFSLPVRFPATAQRRGSVSLISNTDYMSVLGLRFHPGGAFTSLLPMLPIR